MDDYQSRVIAEREDLAGKATRLAAFFDTPVYEALPQAEKDRMARQIRHMNDYKEVLDERIAAF
jgi:hypothetical protein